MAGGGGQRAANRIAVEQLCRGHGGDGADAIDFQTPIDRSKFFVCETLTPLFYASVYRELTLEQRRRYNQLNGLVFGELIGMFEEEFAIRALRTIARDRRAPATLRAMAERFIADEERHTGLWWRLNQLAEPSRYAEGPRRLVRPPPGTMTLAGWMAQRPHLFPVIIWLILTQEERSLEVSRRCVRPASGEAVEPRFAAVYRAHIRDEINHVHADWHLLDHYYAGRSAAVRRATAILLHKAILGIFLTPAGSALHAVKVLVEEHPELRPLAARMRRELRAVGAHPAYRRMVCSRQSHPISFMLLDRHAEFRGLLRLLDPPAEPGSVAESVNAPAAPLEVAS